MEQASWKLNGIFNADAQKCYEEIGDGKVTPESVLERARDEDSELHKCFCWDDTEAAEKFRLMQARQVIQFLVVRPKVENPQPVRMFQITSERNVYQPTRLFLTQPDEYQTLLKRAKQELAAIRERYKTLTELESVFEAIESL